MKSKSEILTIDAAQRDAVTSGNRMSVVAIEDLDVLEDYVQAWEDLAEEALEVNPFYEPWMLMPALRGLATGKNVRVVLVLTIDRGEPVLCGVFPLERKARYKGLPVAVLKPWQHLYCPLCTPLIRASCARECLDAFLDWLAGEARCPLMAFNLVSGDGPFYELLHDCLTKRNSLSFASESYERALFRPMETADIYERTAISVRHRQDMRRRQRRLSELGRVEFDALEPDGDVDKWIDEFLQLEVSSWKGKQGGAFACAEANRNYFVTVAKEAFRRGKLMISAIRLDGQPLALRLGLTAGRGAFGFKIAYDENHARFSPGILLEIENIRLLHSRPDIEWMDSCAAPVHFINRLWLDRRAIQSVLVSTGRRTGDLVISLMPSIRRLNRTLRGLRKSPDLSSERENESRELPVGADPSVSTLTGQSANKLEIDA
jgi:CelD/BcsL family acetyltransferase involved in cellulose biosynthesis